MMATRKGPRLEERVAADRFRTGAAVGMVAGIVGFVLPVVLVLFATYAPGGLVPAPLGAIQDASVLAVLASLLFTISLFLYRSGFASLRGIDPRFWSASLLCLVGTVGFLLILVAAAITLYSSDVLAVCLQGTPTQIASCLLSAAPSAAYTGGVGLALVWLGDFGVVVGLGLAGQRWASGGLVGGAVAYGALLVVLAGPILSVVDPIGGLAYPLLAGPVLVVLAPALVASGSRR
jgi:hypothetical protein